MRTKKVTKRDNITFNESMLKGIDYIDVKSAMYFIKSIVSSDVKKRKSPYVAVRALVKFFDKEKGVRRHGRGGSADVVRYLTTYEDTNKAITFLTCKDSELISLIYDTNQTLYDYQLIQKILWKIQEIKDETKKLIDGIGESQCMHLYGNTEAIKGTEDGRLIGLSELVIRAWKSIYDIERIAQKIENLTKKGLDPREYETIAATRPTGRLWGK